MRLPTYFFGALAVSVVLTGCATIPADRGGSVTTELLKSRSPLAARHPIASTATAPQTGITDLISKPIGADDAVRLALMQNPRMRELYSELGFAQADVYDATRLSNPVLGYLRLTGDGVTQTTWSISQSFTELLFIGYRTRVGRSQLLQTEQRIANDVLALEAQVRTQYYRYVGAHLIAQMRSRAADAAKASMIYAQQLFDAGNISALQLSREQAASGMADIKKRDALTTENAARNALLNLLGLTLGDSRVSFIEQLPLPAAFTADVKALQSAALNNRLDLAAAREAVAMWTANATHVRRWRWLGGITLGAEHERDTGGETIKGPSANVELPLFNRNGSQLLRARASLELANTNVAALELTINNDVATQYAALQSALLSVDQFRHNVIPINQRIIELTQREQNFMLIGAFELLSAKQQQIDVYQSYLETVRDYWIEHTELARVIGGALPESSQQDQGKVGSDIDTPEMTPDTTSSPAAHNDHSMSDMPSMSGDTP